MVRSFNPTAEQIFGLSSTDVLNQPIESASSRIAGLVRETQSNDHNFRPLFLDAIDKVSGFFRTQVNNE